MTSIAPETIRAKLAETYRTDDKKETIKALQLIKAEAQCNQAKNQYREVMVRMATNKDTELAEGIGLEAAEVMIELTKFTVSTFVLSREVGDEPQYHYLRYYVRELSSDLIPDEPGVEKMGEKTRSDFKTILAVDKVISYLAQN
ncbi:hypothetical protein KBC75_05440 [Candidatus Shapirobacteria bacterium]|nr:hypothetical protein [Candidatus Shapirobacteria bacterium]